jgi:hypothetical protein
MKNRPLFTECQDVHGISELLKFRSRLEKPLRTFWLNAQQIHPMNKGAFDEF